MAAIVPVLGGSPSEAVPAAVWVWAELPKAPLGTAAPFSCFICTCSVGINLTWCYLKPQHGRLLGSPPSKDPSSAELCFTPACEPGQMGRERQRRMKGSNHSCCYHSLVATGHLLGPMLGRPSGLKEGTLTSSFYAHLQRTPCLQILHSMYLQHHCLQWVCRSWNKNKILLCASVFCHLIKERNCLEGCWEQTRILAEDKPWCFKANLSIRNSLILIFFI